MKKKMCFNCLHHGEIWRFAKGLGINLPHCHCNRPNIPESERGWGTLHTIFDSACAFYEARQDIKEESQSHANNSASIQCKLAI